jgi:hypothetical protein
MVMNEALEARVVEQLDSISTNLADLDALYHGVLDELENAADKIWMSVATLDYQLPVCLSGIGILPYRQDNVITRAVCFFAIIPEVTETEIVIGALKGHDRALEMYLRDESSTAVLERLGEVDVPWKRSLVYDSVGLECHSAAPQERYL